MRRSPALSLLPVLLCALLCTGCQSTPEDAVPYSEDAIYAFLEDAVLSGEPSVTGYFTGNGTAPSSDALDALLHEAIDQSGILYYYVSEYCSSLYRFHLLSSLSGGTQRPAVRCPAV